MSPDDQRIAIAEACGWGNIIKNTQDEWHFLTTNELVGLRGSTMCGRNIRLFPDGLHHAIPNYLNDLNAMHEAEAMLTPDQCWVMSRELAKECGIAGGIGSGAINEMDWHASASKRARAFLRTIGKWRDS